MGIKNLAKIIRSVAPNAVKEISMESLRGTTISIDVPIFMYKFTYINPTDPLEGFRMQLETFKNLEITPIYVFDGKTAPVKEPEMIKRREMKRKAVDNLAEAEQNYKEKKAKIDPTDFTSNIGDLVDACNQFEKAKKKVQSVPTKASYIQLEKYFTENNVQWMQAKNDAEKTCANLVSSGKAFAVVSEDFDTLPYLCGMGIKGKLITGFGKETMKEYDLEQLLSTIKMNQNQFIDFCILSGCDLCSKIKNIAGKRALTLVQSHKSIENIIRVIDKNKYKVPEEFHFQAAREEFGIVATTV